MFMPPKDLRLSVYEIAGLADVDIWALGTTYVAAPQGKALMARADFEEEIALSSGLTVENVPIPHPRHRELCGWPEDTVRQRPIAIRLAASARLIIA